MKGDPIPDINHVARYCRATASDTGAAFLLRAGESFISVNWLEYLRLGTRSEEIEEVRRVLGSKLTLGKNAKIAVLNVGETYRYVASESPDGRKLRFLHDPEDPLDKSHSGIYDTKSEDEMLIAELIAETIVEQHPACKPD